MAPVSASIEEEPFTSVAIDEGVLTLAGTPGGRALHEWFPEGGSARVRIMNGNGETYSLLLARTSAGVHVLAPTLDDAPRTITPATTITLRGSNFSARADENTVRFVTPDARIFRATARASTTQTIDVVVPLLPAWRGSSFYTGSLALSVETAPGYGTRAVGATLVDLPELTTAPGVLIAETITAIETLSTQLQDSAIQQLVASGMPSAQLQALRQLPHDVSHRFQTEIRRILAGESQAITFVDKGEKRTIVIDRASVLLLERILQASGTVTTLQIAAASIPAAACGETAVERTIRAAELSYIGLDKFETLLTVLAPTVLAIGALTGQLPAAAGVVALILKFNGAATIGQLLIATAPIQLRQINLVPTVLTVADGATGLVTIHGIFEPLLAGTSVEAVLNQIIDAVLDHFLRNEKAKDIVAQLFIFAFGWVIEETLEKWRANGWQLPLLSITEVALSEGTTRISAAGSEPYVTFGPLCSGTMSVSAHAPTPRRLTYQVFADFYKYRTAASRTASATVVVTEAARTAPTAAIDLRSGTSRGTENQTLTVDVQPGDVATILATASRSRGTGALRYQWTLDSAPIGTARDLTIRASTGTHTVRLTVTDDRGTSTAHATLRIVIPAQPPVAGFTMTSDTQAAREGETLSITAPQSGIMLSFSASRSYDPQGGHLNYQWHLNGTSAGAGKEVARTLAPGTHTMLLVVANAAGTQASATGTINVAVQGTDQPTITSITPTATPLGPASVTIAGTNFHPNALTARITGPTCPSTCTIPTFTQRTSTAASFTFTFIAPGVHSITIANGGATSNAATISVTGGLDVSLAVTPSSLGANARSDERVGRTLEITGSAPAWRATTHGGAWLTLTYASGTTPGTTTAILDAASLPAGVYEGTITVTAEPNLTRTIPVRLTVEERLAISGPLALDLALGTTYTSTNAPRLGARGGTPPYTWTSTNMPAGLTLVGDGALTGTPTTPGTFQTDIVVNDSAGMTAASTLELRIHAAQSEIRIRPTAWEPVVTSTDEPTTLPLQIATSDGSRLTGTITSNQSWLTVNGHASASWVAPETVSVTATTAGLNLGTHHATLELTSAGATNAPLMIPVQVRVLAPLEITTTGLPDAYSGQRYEEQLAAIGSTSYTWEVAGGDLPAGLTFSASGRITGIPAMPRTDPLEYTVTFRVRDAHGRTTTKQFTILWREGPYLIGPNSPFPFILNTPYHERLFTAGGGTPPYTWSANGLPPGLAIDEGVITGAPTALGNYTATITLTDAMHLSVTHEFRCTVSSTPLQITAGIPPAGRVGVAYEHFINAAGGSQSDYTWTITGTLPQGLSHGKPPGCSITNCAVRIAGTPTTAGTYPFSATVSDELHNIASKEFEIVINTADPPAITTEALERATIGKTYRQRFDAKGGVPPYTWAFAGASPDTGLAMSASGELHGTPEQPNDCPGGIYTGTTWPTPLRFSAKVTDSAGQSATREYCLVSYYPAPTITNVSPSSIVFDGQEHVIDITGTGFHESTKLQTVNGGYMIMLEDEFVSPTTIRFRLYPHPFAAVGAARDGLGMDPTTVYLRAIRDYSDWGPADHTFAIYAPPPTITSVYAIATGTDAPCAAGLNCHLEIRGTGFYTRTGMKLGEQALLRSSQSAANTPWTYLKTDSRSYPAGTYTLTITNPDQPSGTPAIATATITIPPQ